MKHITLMRSLLIVASQIALPVCAATISTTTLMDENGDGAECSLREAVYAANNNVSFGGCPAGNALADDSIVLSKGTYLLTKGELKVTQALKLFGVNAYRDAINPLTGKKPNRVRPETIIDAGNLSRILSTEGVLDAELELRDVELKNGRMTGNGGAVLSWSSVELDNVVIRSSSALGALTAQGKGGAVYLARSGAGISMTDSMMLNNVAAVSGGAIAMNCEFNGELALHQVSVNRSALDSNSSGSGAGAVFACGSTTMGIQASTVSRNVSAMGTAAIELVNNSLPEDGSLTLRSVTAVENSGGPVFRVEKIAALDVTNTLLAFNGAVNCAITASVSGTSLGTIDGSAIQDSVASGCQVAAVTWGTGNTEIPAAITIDGELAAFSSSIGGLVDGYMPLPGSLYVLNKGQALASCESEDQRGISRTSGTACDAGAVERRELTTVDDEGTNRKTDRIAYVNVLANDTPPEPASLTTTDFWATATVTPTFSATSPGAPVPGCFWENDPDDTEAPFQKVLKIDSHGKTGTFACDYKVEISGSAPSTARVEVEIKNNRPVAVADAYVRPVGTTEVFLDLLANDHDDNDGAIAEAGLYVVEDDDATDFDESTLPAYVIRITQEPSLGSIEGLSSIDCPVKLVVEPDRKCFAAQGLRYVADNNLSPFTDSFKYVVYDKDKEESAEATVTITTDAPDPDRKGGSADWLLLGVLAMAGLRRVRRL